MERNPHLRFRRGKVEVRGHHSDDLAADAFQFDGTADDGGIAAEALLPEDVAQYDVIVLARFIITGIKRVPELGACAQDREEFR